MTNEEQRAMLSIAMLAAFADGAKDDKERAEIRRVAESLSGESDLNVAAVYQDVLLKKATAEGAAAALPSPELRQLAYELAVGVCDADGRRNDAECQFLSGLANTLGVAAGEASRSAEVADAIADAPLANVPPVLAGAVGTADAAGMEKLILNCAVLNGALELLPQSLATMAIIPLQMRMVYQIGKAHGHQLDQGHIKEFLAALGVGLTSQYVEQVGRKLVGGIFRAVAGKLVGRLGSAATGAAFSFATTYALGQVARRYYAAGRNMDMALLKQTFANMLGEGKQLQAQYASQIADKARTLDVGQVLRMVRGG
ncbi:MAG TPA: DUF533 domain-containing protein [Verrucomicrobiae bacterium]|nr:DUF533 domain-containing protein [Verrucomicrobiae bacterium]